MHSDADSIAAAPVSELEPGLDQVQDPIQTAELYCTQSRWSEAIALCQQALEQQPNRVEAYVTWGNAQQAQGEIDRAIASYQAALRQDPRCSRAWVNLGSMFYRQGQLTQAISHYRQAISLDPDLTAAYWNLVLALKQQGLLDEAQVVAQQARDLKVRQQDAVALLVQGKQLAAQGNLEAALNCWQKAVALKPDGVEAYCQIGMALRHQGQASQGISWLEQALKLQPDCIPAHQQLCSILRDSGHFEAARTAVHQYSVLCGEQDPIMTAIYFISTCQVSGLNQIARSRLLELEARLESSMAQLTAIEIKALYANLLFSLPYLRDHLEQNFRLQQKIATAYANQISQPPSLTTGYALKSGRDPLGKPLKIGLISNHYNRHSVGWCSADIVGELAYQGAEIYLYCSGRLHRDDRTQQFEQVAKKLYEPSRYSDGVPQVPDIVQAIQGDQLDVLLDPDALSVPTNVEVLCQRPAPVCISWLGFDAPQISSQNYFLCDWQTHPQGREQYYIEQLVRMPDTFVAISGFEQQPVDPIALRRAYRISPDQTVYVCVAPGRKFSRELAWAQVEILKQVPDSLLIHKAFGDRSVFQSVYGEFCEAAGISRNRIKFLDRLATEEEHRKIYSLADVVLDSYPYNGGTHSLEALWFGVPLVTLRGEQFLSRMGYSFLHSVGISFGVADSWEDYIEYGVQLGRNLTLRTDIQHQLQQTKSLTHLAPLWNPARFSRNLYLALEKLCSGKT